MFSGGRTQICGLQSGGLKTGLASDWAMWRIRRTSDAPEKSGESHLEVDPEYGSLLGVEKQNRWQERGQEQ